MYDNLTRTNLEFAHREAEKRIAELEKEYASLKGLRKYELNVAKLEIEKLEKENAGLKAGKTKWHKVAHGDLPSEEGGWVCNQNGLPCFFDWGTEQWLDCEGTQIRTTEWCHMPHKE